jgi:enoyl-CoA hydratase/carnithine racemase
VTAALDGAGSEETIIESLELFRTAFAHPDAREGARAFLEKRAPVFTAE